MLVYSSNFERLSRWLTVAQHYWFPGEPFNPNLHLIFTTSLVVTAMTLSLATCDLGAVFELIGATSACAVSTKFPLQKSAKVNLLTVAFYSLRSFYLRFAMLS